MIDLPPYHGINFSTQGIPLGICNAFLLVRDTKVTKIKIYGNCDPEGLHHKYHYLQINFKNLKKEEYGIQTIR
jgi:hypothetical protein